MLLSVSIKHKSLPANLLELSPALDTKVVKKRLQCNNTLFLIVISYNSQFLDLNERVYFLKFLVHYLLIVMVSSL